MAGSKISDKILYARLKKRDRDAFIKAYDKYVEDIYRFIYFKVGSKEAAEDIASETFLKSWGHIQANTLKDFATLRALFYRVARNAVIDHYRRENRELEISLDREDLNIDLPDRKQDQKQELQLSQDKEQLMKHLNALKDEYREVLVMRYLNEMDIGEIATVLGKSRGNVRILNFRALKALREMMDATGTE